MSTSKTNTKAAPQRETTTHPISDRDLLNYQRCERMIKRLTESVMTEHIGQFKSALFIVLHDALANKDNSCVDHEVLGNIYALHDFLSEVENVEWKKIHFGPNHEYLPG